MTAILWNCNSIRNKTHYLDTLIKAHDPLIIVLTETQLDQTVIDNELNMHNFDIFRRDRPSKGGGVLIAIKSVSGVKVSNCFRDTEEEMIVLKLTIFNFPVSIVAYYRPPSSTNLNSLVNFFLIIVLLIAISFCWETSTFLSFSGRVIIQLSHLQVER